MREREVAHSKSTRDALILAAIDEIEAVGLRQLTVRRIAKRAEANIAAISYHFGSKEALVSAVLESTLAHMIEDAQAILDGRMSAQAALCGGVGAPRPSSLGGPDAAAEALAEFLRYLLIGAGRYPRLLRAHIDEAAETTFEASRIGVELRGLVPRLAKLVRTAAPGVPASIASRRSEVALSTVLFAAFFPGLVVAPSPAGRKRWIDSVLAVLLAPGSTSPPVR